MTLALLHNAILQVFTNLFYHSHNLLSIVLLPQYFTGASWKLKNMIEHPEIFWLSDELMSSGERINQDMSESRAFEPCYRSVTES